MKKCYFIFFLLIGSICVAQNFNGRTNEVILNFKQPPIPATSLPVISWVTPRIENTISQSNNLDVEAMVNSNVPLKSLKLVLGDGTSSRGEKILPVTGSLSQQVKQTLKLLDGNNTIEIIAENTNGGKISSTRSILVGKDALADAISADRKDYALLFAVDKYDHWSDLVNPIDDATSIAKVLQEKYGFEVRIVENPDHENVFEVLAEYLTKKYKPQDQLMIFFAGHGFFDDTFGEGYVVAKNSLENDKSRTTYISHNRLRSVINNIPCEHIFLTMDVCFGGTFDPVIARARGLETYAEQSETEFLVRKLSYKTRKYLTSGGKEYVSDGISGKHSPFALKIIQALKENGGGKDRVLTISEIKTYVEKLPNEPRFGSFGDDSPASDFVFVAKNN